MNTATAVSGAPARALGRGSAERRFYFGMSLALFAAVAVGFARSFFLRPWFPEIHPLTPKESYFYLHGVVFTAWFLLLVLQPSLVATRRLPLHKRLGWFGAGLAALMVGMGVYGSLLAARRPGGFLGIDIPAAAFLLVPLLDMALFALFIGLAIAWQSDPQSHKRLMLVGSISILTAAIARWPFPRFLTPPEFFGLTDAFLVPLVVWDLRTRRRLHPVTLWGGLLLVASQPFRLWFSMTATWQRVASWMIG